jgi:hypothetical protein
VPVRSGRLLLVGLVLVQELLDVRRVVLDQLLERDRDPLLAELQHLGLAEAVDPRDQEVQVRVVAAGQRDLPLLLGRAGVEGGGLPAELELELVAHDLGHRVGVQVHGLVGRREDIDDGLAVGRGLVGSSVGLVGAARSQGGEQAGREERGGRAHG